ncbi:MAG: sigma-54-dependent Fis family transcriptional regulator, partial [Myxococcales bacterium]|nr:sigma-54-dependent Fis family transcriptional regulator [Myxococcales bacterium]
PGNVRELENVIERAVVLAEGDEIQEGDLPERLHAPSDPAKVFLASGDLSIKRMQSFMERELIARALQKTGGNKTAAAKLLEISHRALLYKVKDYGLD